MGVPLPTLRLRLCGQGRRATGYANASVLRFAPHWANAHPSHASRKGSLKKPFLCILCKVLACKYLYFKLKQGKDITAQAICVRGMEHAVRQYEALAKYRSESAVRNAPTLASARGTPKKII
ncbi:MAG: hypothetical protein NZ519_02740 [Bacteroidia bacterium]|nr:hypothetical protein [Bacteroidia bacterium]